MKLNLMKKSATKDVRNFGRMNTIFENKLQTDALKQIRGGHNEDPPIDEWEDFEDEEK